MRPRRLVVLGRHGPVTADEARARRILGAVAAGQDPAGEKAKAAEAIVVTHFIGLFLTEHVAAKRKAGTGTGTGTGYVIALRNYLEPKLGRRTAESLTSAELSRLHVTLKDRPYQVNRVLAVTGSMYGFAAKCGLVPRGTNSAAGVERLREQKRECYLSSDEHARLGETLRLAETTGVP